MYKKKTKMPTTNYMCPKCYKTFNKTYNYDRHLKRKTPCVNLKDKVEKLKEMVKEGETVIKKHEEAEEKRKKALDNILHELTEEEIEKTKQYMHEIAAQLNKEQAKEAEEEIEKTKQYMHGGFKCLSNLYNN